MSDRPIGMLAEAKRGQQENYRAGDESSGFFRGKRLDAVHVRVVVSKLTIIYLVIHTRIIPT